MTATKTATTRATRSRRLSQPAMPAGTIMTGGGMKDHVRGRWFCATSAGPEVEGFVAQGLVDGVLIALPYSGIKRKDDGSFTFNGRMDRLLDLAAEHNVKVMMDCGAFTLAASIAQDRSITTHEVFAMTDAEMGAPFVELCQTYKAALERWQDRLWGYIEVDMGSRPAREARRAQFIAEGFAPIPVHRYASDSWDELEDLASRHDRIAAGGMVKATPKDRALILCETARRLKNHPHCSLHSLGMTWTAGIAPYDFGSCDSTTWLNLTKYGEPHTRTQGGLFVGRETNAVNIGEPNKTERNRLLNRCGVLGITLHARHRMDLRAKHASEKSGH